MWRKATNTFTQYLLFEAIIRPSIKNKTAIDILISKYVVIFTEFESIDLSYAAANTVEFNTVFTEY